MTLSTSTTARSGPAGPVTFERSLGPMSVDPTRPTETFEPAESRSLPVRGGIPVGPTSGVFPGTYAALDSNQHVMVVAASPFRPQAREMSVDLTGQPTTSFGFQWNAARADNTVEMYAGTKLLGRYTPTEVFADAPTGTTPSAYVTFRTVDGTPITRAVFSSGSPFEVDNLSTDGQPTRLATSDAALRSARSVYTRFDSTAQGPSPITAAAAAQLYRPTVMMADRRAAPLDGATSAPAATGNDIVITEPEIQTRARMMNTYTALAGGLSDAQSVAMLLGMRL